MMSIHSGGYGWFGEVRGWGEGLREGDSELRLTEITRVFPQPWHVVFYSPATRMEAAIRRINVNGTDELSWTLAHAMH
jgi:hypothetical protein